MVGFFNGRSSELVLVGCGARDGASSVLIGLFLWLAADELSIAVEVLEGARCWIFGFSPKSKTKATSISSDVCEGVRGALV